MTRMVGPADEALGEALSSDPRAPLEGMVKRELAQPFQRDASSKPARPLEKYRDSTAE